MDDKKIKLIEANRLLVKTRWFYLLALAITGGLNRISGIAGVNMSSKLLIAIVVTSFLANVLYFIYFWRVKKRNLQTIQVVALLQIVVDIFILTLTIFLAGGIISVSFLYLTFAIIASGFFYQLRGVFFTTIFASILYGGLIWGQYLSIIPYIPRYNNAFEFELAHSFWPVLINTFTIIASFIMIGFFVGNYSRSIRKKELIIIKEKDKVETIISNLVDGLIYVDNNGRVDMLNKRAEKLLEINAKSIIGRNVKKIDYKKYPIVDQVINKLEGKGGEMVPLSKPDSVYNLSAATIRDKMGKAIGSVKIVRDISREKFMEKMKSEFITIAGHQLRTPLSAIKGALFLLESGDYGRLNKDQKQVITQSYEYTDRLINIVNDLLNVSSIEEGRYDYEFEPVDINTLLREIAERFLPEAENRNIKLSTSIINSLSKVELDDYKMKLALGCIISNAITYSKENSQVKIQAEFPDKDRVVISVEDQGIGIPKNMHKKVFAKFFRADNALKFNTEGNGLDLFVAKNIVDNHGGKISFESEKDKGTTFIIELPVKQSEANKTK